ncbi:hypothetical protein NHH03_20950 [Stieleria sp. TO1_6]|uniref:hypothetical protein n=1 Tax=Stieleria tagensis TaxID=2956795 RepID=UPI00209AF628|nr:hypothetical protein [Stieleria tagensis]MCO8124224.1 hypothetical protein [Stieleria tagensis]
MPDSLAARLIDLNQQAIAILRLQIPLDMGLGPQPTNRLQQINQQLASDVDSAVSVDELLARHDLPQRYQTFARMLLIADDPTPLFQSVADPDLERESAANPFRQAITEPLVVAGLAYLGMIFLCLFTLPHIENQYIQEGVAPTGATGWLIAVRDAMPYWIVGFPIAMLLLTMLWHRFVKSYLRQRFPGSRLYSQWLVDESQSRRLAALVGSGVDRDQALTLVGNSVKPPSPVRAVARNLVMHGSPASSPRSLRRLAGFYHFLADDRRRTYFAKVPALLGLLVAATLVLGYALAMFLPWVEVLTNIQSVPGS